MVGEAPSLPTMSGCDVPAFSKRIFRSLRPVGLLLIAFPVLSFLHLSGGDAETAKTWPARSSAPIDG
jgi:hypothetical protein